MPDLSNVRVIAAINGIELFGHERGNIEVFKSLRAQGAEVLVGVSSRTHDGANLVEHELHRLEFSTFLLPFGPQWSIQWVKKDPRIAITNVMALIRCSWIFLKKSRDFRPTHVQLGSPLAYSYLSLALSFTRVPLIYRMGDCPPFDSPFNLRIWNMAMRRCTRVIANSKFVRASAITAGVAKDKITVIHNLAPSTNDVSDNVSEKSGLDKNSQRLIYAGAISEQKGLVELITAFAIVSEKYVDLRLDILGGSRYDSPFRQQIIEMIAEHGLEDKIILHGHVDDPSIFLRNASIHIAPSVWDEPFANVVLEAKKDSVPSIIFPSGGLPEMIHHQVDGYICKERTADALVEGILWMLDGPERLALMGKAAFKDSEMRFGPERFMYEWANIYLETAR
ncbi:MAG: hypothetical protein IEMM0001_1920 [bacterium]|nr:MAG: hypothetical protein IEMM0001_1920 [bacterium]